VLADKCRRLFDLPAAEQVSQMQRLFVDEIAIATDQTVAFQMMLLSGFSLANVPETAEKGRVSEMGNFSAGQPSFENAMGVLDCLLVFADLGVKARDLIDLARMAIGHAIAFRELPPGKMLLGSLKITHV
jgi:hypothetical protein